MICQACSEGDHDRCDDEARRERFVAWMRETFAGVVVGAAEQAIIHANTPYDSCTCQHKIAALAAAVPDRIIDGATTGSQSG